MDVNKDCKIIGISRKDLQKRRDNAEKDAEKERKRVEAEEKKNPAVTSKNLPKVLTEKIEKRAEALDRKTSENSDHLKIEANSQVAIQIPEEEQQQQQQANVKFNLLSPYKIEDSKIVEKNANNNSTNDGLAVSPGVDLGGVGINPGGNRLKGKLEKNRSLTR